MRNLNKIQTKLTWFKIPNLMFYVVLITSISYFAELGLTFNSKTMLVSSILNFDKGLILKGEYWRIFSYIFLMPRVRFPLAFLYIYIINYISNSLEAYWGAAKLTLYYFFGIVFTTIAGFLAGSTNVIFLNLSLIFVFVEIYSDVNVTFFSVINLRASWLGVLNCVIFLIKFIMSIFIFNLPNLLAESAAIFTFVLFFGPSYFINIFNNLRNFMLGQRL